MIEPISPTSLSGLAAADPAVARRREAARPAVAVAETVPASPPQEVLDGLDAAARTLDDLDAKHLDLRLAVDKRTGRVHVDVRDAGGRVLRQVPAGQALDLLAGEPGGVADWHA